MCGVVTHTKQLLPLLPAVKSMLIFVQFQFHFSYDLGPIGCALFSTWIAKVKPFYWCFEYIELNCSRPREDECEAHVLLSFKKPLCSEVQFMVQVEPVESVYHELQLKRLITVVPETVTFLEKVKHVQSRACCQPADVPSSLSSMCKQHDGLWYFKPAITNILQNLLVHYQTTCLCSWQHH